ncbi:MAG: SusD/RagB family nutrient-binding outer membrane lipoprotein [Bacteroidota bacterium]
MKFLFRITVVVLMLGFSSCEMFNLELQDNPNRVAPEKAEINFLYNNLQLTFNNFVNATFRLGADATRMVNMGAFTYNNRYTPTGFNGIWNTAYSAFLPDAEALLTQAGERGLFVHSGTTKIMKAYVLMTMVDLFANVPYTEALQGTDIISPKIDDGASIYTVAEGLLDEAISDLGNDAALPAEDNFYDGDVNKWIALANTLKIRMYMTTRLVDGQAIGKIGEIVAAGNYITDEGGDFEFKYSNQRDNPNSRHPFYNNSYETNDGTYMSNYFMWAMQKGHADGLKDPRMRFYFYRQTSNAFEQDVNVYSCIFSDFPDQSAKPDHYSEEMPYCVLEEGFYGRDHGNGSGIPPDGPIRTVYGLYPGGGNFDDNQFEFTQNAGTDGALGEGITPIMLSSWVDFMLAEAALFGGTGDARDHLENGMTKSMDKVFGWSSKINTAKVVGTDVEGNDVTLQAAFLDSIDVDAMVYRDAILAQFDAADADEKLNIIIKQYQVALWGNGMEILNAYRRTSKPSNLQPSLEPSSGDFPRTFVYPLVFVTLNSQATQKTHKDKVFWDTNPDEIN